MDNHTPIIVIELVLTFGGVLLFGWWQLRSIKRDQQAAAARKLLEAGDEPDNTSGATTPANQANQATPSFPATPTDEKARPSA